MCFLTVCVQSGKSLFARERGFDYLLCSLLLCFVVFLLGVCFLTVCVQCGECLFLGEGSIDYLFVVLCCSFLFLSNVCLCKKGELTLFLLSNVVFFVLFHVYVRVSCLAFACNLSLSAVWRMFVCDGRE